MKPGDLVKIRSTNIKYKILRLDALATKRLNETYWSCRRIGRKCIDSYPEGKLELVGKNEKKMKEETKKPALIYDIQSLPYSMTLEDIVKAFIEFDIVIYDSKKGGDKPVLLDGDIANIIFQDMSSQLDLFDDTTDATIFNPENN